MGVDRYGEEYEKRKDPKGRPYFWATNEPPPPTAGVENDLTMTAKGYVTLTALHFDMTHQPVMDEMCGWDLRL